ncbi:chorismate-binding protein [Helicobacter didelphidarum]|uniref:Chorismate-binding protein n=1 Tax=Helicobacter didelphidarum TaxID=2040648 RepID=A0A3D8INE0_9HELI|nr:anthranilate synthase component I family protein [Helicobacter didelphidarum]RDU66091.1 chorismate-binding protein [Helicobacter didelphidarum]
MFIYGKYRYIKPIKTLIAWNYHDILKCLSYIQTHIDKKKKGYFVGYLTYESAIILQAYHYLEHKIFKQMKTNKLEDSITQPLLYFSLFKKCKKIKKEKDLKLFHKHKDFIKNKNIVKTNSHCLVRNENFLLHSELFEVLEGLNKDCYHKNFYDIKNAISKGESYQVNYTQEIKLKPMLKISSWQYFLLLSRMQYTKYRAYIANEYTEILSFSPELFFKVKGNEIITQPMKGTIARAYRNNLKQQHDITLKSKQTRFVHTKKRKQHSYEIDVKQDLKNKKKLQNDLKNRSENVMIVDLLRNDLSRIATQGSLKVSELFTIHTYPTLHQMVSTIRARLSKKYRILDILYALFPCGSITGAPKLETMSLISQLESRKRGVYCGAIGVLSKKKISLSIPIRTLSKATNESFYRYGVGSGIVWDSNMEHEFEELKLKCNFLGITF